LSVPLNSWKLRPPVPPKCLEIQLCGERLQLHPQRAVLWPARSTLVIADPHFGKDDIFRRAGIALPRGPAIADLQRLTELITANACTRLVVLGDFLHGVTQTGDSFLHAFRLWRQAHGSLTVDIVVGNHDRRESPQDWQQIVGWHTRALIEPPFVLAHEPAAHPEGYVLAGHIHPVLRLRRRSGAGRVPVFWQRREYLVLPSFGSLTGGAEVAVELGDLLYAAGPERVIPLPVGVP
jgi:DNA ligase-associated metallophosphoesterase